MKFNIFGRVDNITNESYTTARGNTYNVIKLDVYTDNEYLQLVAREKVIRLCKDIVKGDTINAAVELVCRKTSKATFTNLDIINLVNISNNGR